LVEAGRRKSNFIFGLKLIEEYLKAIWLLTHRFIIKLWSVCFQSRHYPNLKTFIIFHNKNLFLHVCGFSKLQRKLKNLWICSF
jgi:hypothetical protein